MDFELDATSRRHRDRVRQMMRDRVLPAEATYREEAHASGNPFHHPQVMEDMKAEARAADLWNLFLPDPEWGAGLTNLQYAPVAEETGWSLIGPEVFNCNAPDTGNMEVLAQFGSRQQQQQWLVPLLAGEIRSCFSMTEPDVASSDARNIESRIVREGDEYVIDGRKWWTTGAPRERCTVSIFMGKTDPDADTYHQQSMILVPLDTPGVTLDRTLSVFGYDEGEGHAQMTFSGARVPATNLLQSEGDGFRIAQGRLGPGRIHHCMRSIGMAERALELMCRRTAERAPFGKPLYRQGVVQEWIARSRLEIEQARLLTLKAAWMMDTVGNKAAKTEIAAIKVIAPSMALRVLDRSIQVHGGAGVSQDFPLASAWANMRTLRLADGPDEVHLMQIARQELKRQLSELEGSATPARDVDAERG